MCIKVKGVYYYIILCICYIILVNYTLTVNLTILFDKSS